MNLIDTSKKLHLDLLMTSNDLKMTSKIANLFAFGTFNRAEVLIFLG